MNFQPYFHGRACIGLYSVMALMPAGLDACSNASTVSGEPLRSGRVFVERSEGSGTIV